MSPSHASRGRDMHHDVPPRVLVCAGVFGTLVHAELRLLRVLKVLISHSEANPPTGICRACGRTSVEQIIGVELQSSSAIPK